MLAAAPHREWRAALSSAVWGQQEGRRELRGAVPGRSKGELGKGFALGCGSGQPHLLAGDPAHTRRVESR